MKVIGEQMAEYIVRSGNNFRDDLIDANNHDQLVTFFGDVDRIKKQMSDPKWLDNFTA